MPFEPLALRQTKSHSILDDIKAYLEAEKPKGVAQEPGGRSDRLHALQLASLERYSIASLLPRMERFKTGSNRSGVT